MFVAQGGGAEDAHDQLLNQLYYRVIVNTCANLRDVLRTNPSVEASFDQALGRKRREERERQEQMRKKQTQKKDATPAEDTTSFAGAGLLLEDEGCASIWTLEVEMEWRRNFISRVNASRNGGVFVPRRVVTLPSFGDDNGGQNEEEQNNVHEGATARAVTPSNSGALHQNTPFDTLQSYETLLSERVLVPLSSTIYSALNSSFAAAADAVKSTTSKSKKSRQQEKAKRARTEEGIDVDNADNNNDDDDAIASDVEGDEDDREVKKSKRRRKDISSSRSSGVKNKEESAEEDDDDEGDETEEQEEGETLPVNDIKVEGTTNERDSTTAKFHLPNCSNDTKNNSGSVRFAGTPHVPMDVPSRQQQRSAFLRCTTPLALLNARQWTSGHLLFPGSLHESDVLAEVKRRADAQMLRHAVQHNQWYAPLFSARLDAQQQQQQQEAEEATTPTGGTSVNGATAADPDRVVQLVSMLSERRGKLLEGYYDSARRVLDLKLKQHLRASLQQQQQQRHANANDDANAINTVSASQEDVARVARSYLLLQRHAQDTCDAIGVDRYGVNATTTTATTVTKAEPGSKRKPSEKQKEEYEQQQDPVLRVQQRDRPPVRVDEAEYLRGVGVQRVRGSAGEKREVLWLHQSEEEEEKQRGEKASSTTAQMDEKEQKDKEEALFAQDPELARYLWPRAIHHLSAAAPSWQGGGDIDDKSKRNVACASSFARRDVVWQQQQHRDSSSRREDDGATPVVMPAVINHGILRLGALGEFPFSRMYVNAGTWTK